MRSAAFAVEATLVFLASRINEKLIKINSNSIGTRIKCTQWSCAGRQPWVSDVQIHAKLIEINSNSITIRIKCAQQPSRLKPPLCFWRPGSMKNQSKSIQIAQQPSRLKPPSYFWRPGEGFKGGGFGVCGRQDLDFKFKQKKLQNETFQKPLPNHTKTMVFSPEIV